MTEFEKRATEAMIELGFNEEEKHYDFHTLVRYKSGKKKGQVRYTQATTQQQAAREEWRAKEKARLAEKYGLPKFWEEGLREKLGNEKFFDLGYVGRDKWWKVEGNREKMERAAELSGRGMMGGARRKRKRGAAGGDSDEEGLNDNTVYELPQSPASPPPNPPAALVAPDTPIHPSFNPVPVPNPVIMPPPLVLPDPPLPVNIVSDDEGGTDTEGGARGSRVPTSEIQRMRLINQLRQQRREEFDRGNYNADRPPLSTINADLDFLGEKNEPQPPNPNPPTRTAMEDNFFFPARDRDRRYDFEDYMRVVPHTGGFRMTTSF